MDTEFLDSTNLNKFRSIEYATFLDRFLAFLLDFLITFGPIFYLVYLGYTQKNLMFLLISAVLGMLYKPFMEGIWGATLGKMIMKITVVDSDMATVGLGQSILKNTIYIVSSVLGILGHFWLVGTERFQESEGYMEVAAITQDSPYSTVTIIWMVVIIGSCFAMFASDKGQTLHDRLANTFCVKNSSME
ncbi:MAG: RDD family protein [Bacteroidota bacterium]